MLVAPKYAKKVSSRIVNTFADEQVPWGPIGYPVFKRTYARMMDSGITEEWFQTIERGINGLLEIGAVYTHQDVEDLFYYWHSLKGCPAGRPIWQLGTETVRRHGGDSLNNCWVVLINEPIDPFTFAFNELLLGGGVGFNILPEHVYEIPIVKHNVKIERVDDYDCDFIVPDNREGWIELLKLTLSAFFFTGKDFKYDTRCIRPKGRRINGFGGIASGPEELVTGIGQIAEILRSRVGRKLTPVNCMDTLNIIGNIVKSGNVRRCFPGNTPVYTTHNNITRIDEIKVGDAVKTLNGYKKVTNVFKQGRQKLVSVILSNRREIRCTPNHKFAVLTDMYGEIDWVEAQHLNSEDTLLINSVPCNSDNKIDPIKAYFFGNFAGDGSVYLRSAASAHGLGGTVTFAITHDTWGHQIADKLNLYLDQECLYSKESFQGGCLRFNIYNTDFAREMIKYRVPKQCPIIPEWIFTADVEARSAYVAGLCDADGEANRYNLCNSKYKSLLIQLQQITTSLGIDTYIHTRPDRVSNQTGKIYDNQNQLIIRGSISKKNACRLFNPHIIKKLPEKLGVSWDATIPYQFAKDAYDSGHITKSELNNLTWRSRIDKPDRNPIHRNLIELSDFWKSVIPVQVTEVIDFEEEAETYDIEVEGDHCYFADGVLVHNSAEIAIGSPNDEEFLSAKDWSRRVVPAYRQMSNNTVLTDDILLLPEIFWRGYEGKGEAYGLFNQTLARKYGRLIDGLNYRPDPLVVGCNPCSEQPMEDREACNLAETFLPNITDVAEFAHVTELLFRACKAISTLPYWHPKTQEVVNRNHRIGIGVTGFLQAQHLNDPDVFDAVYDHLEASDRWLSREMKTTESIKLTTVKPSGTLSLLAGVSPGVHAEFANFYIRRVAFANNDPIVQSARDNGYNVEPKVNVDNTYDFNTVVVDFPCKARKGSVTANGYSAIQQLENQLFLQTHWSDSSVSVTCYFQPEELPEIKAWMHENYADSVKTASFLLYNKHGFQQAPYEEITESQYYELKSKCMPITSIEDTVVRELVDSEECSTGGCPTK